MCIIIVCCSVRYYIVCFCYCVDVLLSRSSVLLCFVTYHVALILVTVVLWLRFNTEFALNFFCIAGLICVVPTCFVATWFCFS